ncbi:MAG: hypothetical protein RL261_110 [Pseudomonadota bacterium]|jgi:hypothetical protein
MNLNGLVLVSPFLMYVHGPSMQKFRNDLVGFIRATDRL